MARVHLLETHRFGIDREPIVVVDCDLEGEAAFDVQHAKRQAKRLKKQAEAAAVVVQLGAKFWVV